MNLIQTRKLWLTEPELCDVHTTVLKIHTIDTADSAIHRIGTTASAKTRADLTEHPSILRIGVHESIAFPGGGGQEADRAFINEVKADSIEEENGVCWFSFNKNTVPESFFTLTEGSHIRLTIDEAFRRDQMEQHSGQHLLSAVLFRAFSIATESFHLGSTDVTIDVSSTELSPELLAEVQEKVHTLALSGVSIVASEVSKSNLHSGALRRKPPDLDIVRVVTIGDDSVACCGTHFDKAFKALPIVLCSFERVKKKSRIHFLCGSRARRHISALTNTINSLTTVLNSPFEKLIERTRKLVSDSDDLRAQVSQLTVDKALSTALSTLETTVPALEGWRYITCIYDDIDLKTGGRVLTELLKNDHCIALFVIVGEDTTTLLLGMSATKEQKPLNVDCCSILRDVLKKYDGKGGGAPLRAQGCIPCKTTRNAVDDITKLIERTSKGE